MYYALYMKWGNSLKIWSDVENGPINITCYRNCVLAGHQQKMFFERFSSLNQEDLVEAGF